MCQSELEVVIWAVAQRRLPRMKIYSSIRISPQRPRCQQPLQETPSSSSWPAFLRHHLTGHGVVTMEGIQTFRPGGWACMGLTNNRWNTEKLKITSLKTRDASFLCYSSQRRFLAPQAICRLVRAPSCVHVVEEPRASFNIGF